MSSSWQWYDRDLDAYAKQLSRLEYSPITMRPQGPRISSQGFFTLTYSDANQPLVPGDVLSLLSEPAIGPPHGYDLLQPLPIPNFPSFPDRPSAGIPTEKPFSVLGWSFGAPRPVAKDGFSPKILEKERQLLEQTETLRQRLLQQSRNAQASFRALQQRCAANDYEAIRLLLKFCHEHHDLPAVFRKAWEVDFDQTSRVVLCSIEIPDFHSLAILKKNEDRWKAKAGSVSATERRRLNETIIYSLCLRAAYLVAKCNVGAWFDIVAVNATQKWHEAATGQPREGIIATLQASVSEILQLDLTRADPKACFRHLKGLSTPSTEDVSPVRPIFVVNKDDQRIVEEKDVAENLEPESNIAAMPWEDFEHLVRQLFEWEFGRSGVEVKVTRASRDRGVDAIMFDPHPLRGGKFVLQAKRYTRTVDVAAVRDLYGTVVNEGANRGILVTTSSYGPDAYEFAKDKPLSLVDGQHLLAMLRRHGRKYRIDLAEARKLAAYEKDGETTRRPPDGSRHG
jgi:restriction system protein